MNNKNKKIYPNSFIKIRQVEIGGLSKEALIQQLNDNHILLNEYGKKLFEDDCFVPCPNKYMVESIELTVRDLGLFEGATLTGIYNKASDLGLKLCPLEMAFYLRLSYLDQAESPQSPKYQAPKGSITIASDTGNKNPDFPKGFYIRNIKGQLWLRAYVTSDDHIWSPDDHFVFLK